ncbi:TetR/AcrR family transcriptional regulator [Pseudonocardia kongjuensis]|uniref:TetR/AcrR family transcriptional regulator n=1 Tax=Pseudonocardia kongjuensis TaxID=102227 RepID=UPI0031DC6B3A
MSRGGPASGNFQQLRVDVLDPGREPPDATAGRVLSAARRVVEEFGLRRFTMDQVARRGRVSRMTVYRHFPRKDELVRALLTAELRRFTTEADAVVEAEPTIDGKLAVGVRFCVEHLRRHPVLARLLRTEPEILLPHLTTAGGPLISVATEWISGHVRREVAAAGLQIPPGHVQPLAELLVRLVVSLVLNPVSTLDLDSDEGWDRVRALYVAPFVAVLAREAEPVGGAAAPAEPVAPAEPAAAAVPAVPAAPATSGAAEAAAVASVNRP